MSTTDPQTSADLSYHEQRLADAPRLTDNSCLTDAEMDAQDAEVEALAARQLRRDRLRMRRWLMRLAGRMTARRLARNARECDRKKIMQTEGT